VVLSFGLFGHADNVNFTDDEKEKLEHLQKQKVLLADYVYVINPSGYIGESTKSAIEFAKALGKPVMYLEAPDEVS